jgi:hypothetical protein
MATLPEEQIQPVAAVTPVATPTAVPKLAPTLTPSAVYSPINVKQVLTKSTNKYKDMKLSKLEKSLAGATSQAELNEIAIKNQPVQLGVAIGQAAHQSALDTARINSVTGLYNAKLLDEQRKEAERQQFIQTYGADPSQRPKGMSKREFSAALQGGGFQNLLSPEFKAARESAQLDLALKRKQLAGGGTGSTTAVSNLNSLLEKAAQMPSGGREWAASVATTFGVNPQDVINATQQNGWESAYRKPLTPTEQAALDASTPNPAKTKQQLDLVDSAIKTAEGLQGAAGRSGARRTFESWFIGSTDYTQLVAAADTIKTNILTLSTDPNIKKFFGPQMSEADVRMMTSAGTMLNPELQSPEQLNASLNQAKDLIKRAKEAVQNGQKQEQIVSQPDIYQDPKTGKQYRRGSDGLYYEQ